MTSGHAHAVNLRDKLALITQTWTPHVIAELNGQQVKLAKLQGELVWHAHADEDELFYVIEGELTIRMREREITLRPGELFVVPRGVEHCPSAPRGAAVMLFEPASTRHAGDVRCAQTRDDKPRS